jgi:hypothetical protein
MQLNPDKKKTKVSLFRILFSPFLGANTRRAVLATRELKETRSQWKTIKSDRAQMKQWKKDGTLR